MKRKLTVLILAALCAVSSAACLSACNTTPEATTPPPAGSEDEKPKEEEKPSETELTFADFIKDHKTDALNFFEDNIKPAVVEGVVEGKENVKAENWHLNDKDGDNKVESASMSFIYNINETERAVQVANVTFDPIDVQDIVKAYKIDDGKVTSENTTVVSREDVFTFDAKENYLNQDLAAALYNAGNVDSATKLFKDAKLNSATRTQYEIVNITDSGVKVTYVTGDKANSKEEFINNLSKDNVKAVKKSETKLEGVSFYSTGYTLEEFKDDEKPGPGPIVSDVTNAEIISALDNNCKVDLVKAVIPTYAANNFNEANLSDTTWYLTKDTDGNITKAELTFVYKTSDTAAIFVIGEMNLSSPISAKDIVDGKIGNVTFNRTADRFSFNPAVQAERADLTNAICDKVFGAHDNTVRYIYDHGNNSGSSVGLARHFTVMEVNNNTINQIDIDILQSDNDSQYISKLNNESNYTTYSEKTQTISGEKVTIEATKNTQEASYRYAVDFGDDELYYL